MEPDRNNILRSRIETEDGYWLFHDYPICIACGKRAESYTILPYSSRYDEEAICDECLVEVVDSGIDRKRTIRGEKAY